LPNWNADIPVKFAVIGPPFKVENAIAIARFFVGKFLKTA
jgi:hypothetical protein